MSASSINRRPSTPPAGDLASPPPSRRGRHRPEHAHTVDVGIFLARDRAEKAVAK